MTSPFEQRYRELCELADMMPMPVQMDDTGALLGHLTLHEVVVDVGAESEAAAWIFTRVHFGPVLHGDDLAWSDLLEMNFALAHAAAPAFACDPDTSDVMLQQRWPGDVPMHELYAMLGRHCQAAKDWRSARSAGAAHLHPGWPPDLAAARLAWRRW